MLCFAFAPCCTMGHHSANKSFTRKVKHWQVQSAQEREVSEETALYVPLQYSFPRLCLCACTESSSGEAYFSLQNESQLLSSCLQPIKPLLQFLSSFPHPLLSPTFSLDGFLWLWCFVTGGRSLYCLRRWPVSQAQAITPTTEQPLIPS